MNSNMEMRKDLFSSQVVSSTARAPLSSFLERLGGVGGALGKAVCVCVCVCVCMCMCVRVQLITDNSDEKYKH